MVFVCSQMPEALKKTLLQQFYAAFDGERVLNDRDTMVEKQTPRYECVHYAVYNRYATSVSLCTFSPIIVPSNLLD